MQFGAQTAGSKTRCRSDFSKRGSQQSFARLLHRRRMLVQTGVCTCDFRRPTPLKTEFLSFSTGFGSEWFFFKISPMFVLLSRISTKVTRHWWRLRKNGIPHTFQSKSIGPQTGTGLYRLRSSTPSPQEIQLVGIQRNVDVVRQPVDGRICFASPAIDQLGRATTSRQKNGICRNICFDTWCGHCDHDRGRVNRYSQPSC